MNKKTTLKLILYILIIMTLLFIFSNSLEPAAQSEEKSESVMGLFTPFLEFIFGKGNVTDFSIRKIAHFIEFCLLGIEIMLLAILNKRNNVQRILNCLFFGLSTAVFDESLQLLNDRSAQVEDILLDFSGFITGLLLIIFLNYLKRTLFKNS